MKYAFLCKSSTSITNKRVAIIGSGPAGLAIAGYLACKGFEIDVYDKLPLPGGLMTFAIPRYRIPFDSIIEGIEDLKENFSVKFYLSTKVCTGNDLDEGDELVKNIINLSTILDSYDAVVLATGTWKSRKLNIPGENSINVFSALNFLLKLRLHELKFHNSSLTIPKRVVVIGAGLSAVDVAEECIYRGAEEVHMVYRRTINEAPAGIYHINKLKSMGIKWIELASPKRIIAEGNVAKAVEFIKMRLGGLDESGRPKPIPIPGSEFIIETDAVIVAIGEVPTPPIYEGPLLKYIATDRRIIVDEHYRIPGTKIFAAGDVVIGPSKIGKAIRHGLYVAKEVTKFLGD